MGLGIEEIGSVWRSRAGSRWPTMAVFRAELCVAWSEADEGASQVVVHCIGDFE